MKITGGTISVLENFAEINMSIIVEQGNVLKTISKEKTIVGKATVDTSFEQRFAIYNLNRFLSTLSLIQDPELQFGEKSVKITGGNTSAEYTFASEDMLVKPPSKDIKLPEPNVSFTLTEDTLKKIRKALGVLGFSDIVVHGDGSSVTVRAADTKNPSSDVFALAVGSTDKKFNVVFKRENIKILPGDYTVDIAWKGDTGISHFTGPSAEYFIAIESESTFEK